MATFTTTSTIINSNFSPTLTTHGHSTPASGSATPTNASVMNPRSSLLGVNQHCATCRTKLSPSAAEAAFDEVYTSVALQATFSDLEQALRKHCADLHQIDLLMPPTLSRAPSVASVRSTTQQYPRTSTPAVFRDALGLAIPGDHPQAFVPDNASERSVATIPVVHDVEDVKRLTAGVTRLLKTLHDKVTAVEQCDRQLRAEREALAKSRTEVEYLRRQLAARRSASNSPQRRRGSSDTHGPRLSRAISFNVDDEQPLWNSEKEEQLKELEKRLRNANRKWSDEQEDVLELIDKLQEERRKAKKSSNKRHSTTTTDEGLQRKDSKISLRSRRNSTASRGEDASGGGYSPKEKSTTFRRLNFWNKKKSISD